MAKIRAQLNIQGRYKEQDSSLATRFLCATCLVSYYAERAGCPHCDVTKRLEQTQLALAQAHREIEQLSNMNKRLAEQVDGSIAIKGALDLLDDHDMNFLKTVLYQWKIDRSVNLRVTHGSSGKAKSRRRKLRANGFIAVYRDKPDPVVHACSSMGGLAIAEYYEEGLNTAGHERALNMLLKGFSSRAY